MQREYYNCGDTPSGQTCAQGSLILTLGDAIDGVIAKCYLYAENRMDTVTVSPKFRVVIPKRIREKLGLSPGRKLRAILFGDRVELIPIRPIKEMRGFLKGIATTVEREADRP